MTDYPKELLNQITFMENLESELNSLSGSMSSITLSQATKPTHDEWEAKWELEGNELPIPTGAEMYWHDGDKLRDIRSVIARDYHALLLPLYSGDDGTGTFLNNQIFSIDTNDDGTLFVVAGSWHDLNVIAAYLVNRDGQFTLIPNTTDCREAAFNDDATQIIWIDSTPTEIFKINVDGTGLTTIISGLTNIDHLDWRGNQIAFQSGLGDIPRTATDSGAGLVALSADAVNSVIINPTNSRIYFNNKSNNYTGTDEQTEWTVPDGVAPLDIDIANQKIYGLTLNNFTSRFEISRANLDGTELETMEDFFETVVRHSLFNQSPSTAVPVNQDEYMIFGKYTWAAHYGHWRAFRLAQNKDTIIALPDTSSVPNGRSAPFILANTLKGETSTGQIVRITDYDTPVADFELLIEKVLDSEELSIDLTIPQTHKNLFIVLEFNTRENTQDSSAYLEINGDTTAANYHTLTMQYKAALVRNEKIGTNAGIHFDAKGRLFSPTTARAGFMAFVTDYRGSQIKQMQIMGGAWIRTDGTPNLKQITANGVWNSSAAISRIRLFAGTGDTFQIGSVISVYGLNGNGEYYSD